MTPTADTLMPLVDAVTANFRIALTAVNILDPILYGGRVAGVNLKTIGSSCW
jgi:hypothetical protein